MREQGPAQRRHPEHQQAGRQSPRPRGRPVQQREEAARHRRAHRRPPQRHARQAERLAARPHDGLLVAAGAHDRQEGRQRHRVCVHPEIFRGEEARQDGCGGDLEGERGAVASEEGREMAAEGMLRHGRKCRRPGRGDRGASASGKRDSNPRPQPWESCALPTELFPQGLQR